MINENLPIKDILKSDVFKEIYGDLAKPGISALGRSLGTLFELSYTILLPIKLLNEKSRIIFERNIEKYKERIQSEDNENIIEIAPEIGIPLLDKLTYVEDENISELYINLLANAASKKTAYFAHPSFISIIENLSPDEAKIIQYLIGEKINIKSHLTIKYIKFRGNLLETSAGRYLSSRLTNLENQLHLLYPQNINIYLENLITQGILSDKYPSHILESYADLEKSYDTQFTKLKNESSSEFLSVEIRKSYLEVTELGNFFLSSCSTHLYKTFKQIVELQKVNNYEEAIVLSENLYKNNILPTSLLSNLLEFYLLVGKLTEFNSLYLKTPEIFDGYRNTIIGYYLQIFCAYHENNIPKIKEFTELIRTHMINSKEKKELEWDFSDLIFFLKNEPNTEIKIEFENALKSLALI
ncbi:DUF4393 domain-containing protein [Leptospira sp. 'Mane']|uniref:DUF4393 domain-containing protein n=1 Tax=Leptospira sp. 'Mane' TaxID=3387407 RepID=UPI00398A7A4B